MFYIFEMANNHQGSVDHAKKIIDKFAFLAEKYNLSAGVKLQFRQLETFIHKDFWDSDLKYVKRFRSTQLSKDQFEEIVNHVKLKGMTTISTPFDNESIPWLEDLDVSVIKVASCSSDDWPLLREIAKINKKIIISTGGATMSLLNQVYDLFKKNDRDFAFMHCVGEYPTPTENSNLNRIKELRENFPDIEIGISTHESPRQKSVVPYAVAMGCTIVEKHVGLATEDISLNGYSCTMEDMEVLVQELEELSAACNGKSLVEKDALYKLKRGIYAKRNIEKGESVSEHDFYYAMPLQDGQSDASKIDEITKFMATKDIFADDPVSADDFRSVEREQVIGKIKTKALELLESANVTISRKDKVEISAHYGLQNFFRVGALIVDKVNREYCKKVIVVMNNQFHPSHKHIKKEESFELLHGDCTLNLNGTDVRMKIGEPMLITRGTAHSFRSKNGCVLEEISTTHIPGDSVYKDPDINKLKLEDRKININLL